LKLKIGFVISYLFLPYKKPDHNEGVKLVGPVDNTAKNHHKRPGCMAISG